MENTDAQKNFFIKGVTSITEEYTPEQVKILAEFMHADFPHWQIGGGRNGSLTVQNPSASICSTDEWRDSLDTIILPEWETLHPTLKKAKMIVRFVPKLQDYKNGVILGGSGNLVTTKEGLEAWYRIPFLDNNNDLIDQQNLLFVIAHEIAETDFWKKTTNSERSALYKENEQSAHLLKTRQHAEYNNLTDEKIANQRAWRALKRKWPHIENGDVIQRPVEVEEIEF